MSRYAPGSSSSATRSSREIDESAQTAASTRSYASLMMVLPRSKRNQVSDMVVGYRLPVLGSRQRTTEHRALHPEHSKPRVLDPGVVRNRESEAEVRAGLGGIDDAIVPESRGRVIGRALRLVLAKDGI